MHLEEGSPLGSPGCQHKHSGFCQAQHHPAVWATGDEAGQVSEVLDMFTLAPLSKVCFISFPLGTVQFYHSFLLYRNYLHILERTLAKKIYFCSFITWVLKKPKTFLSSSAENVALLNRPCPLQRQSDVVVWTLPQTTGLPRLSLCNIVNSTHFVWNDL